jgi:hypothetical protein
MLGGFIFAVALLPALTSKDKPPILTSLTTGVVLLIYSIAYSTLELWLACTATAITSIVWFILFIQVIIRDIRKKQKRRS